MNLGHLQRAECKRTDHKLRRILEMTKDHWDRPTERDAVRENFRKVGMCGTLALGGEVYASALEQKVFPHTCKSKCCPSCGNRGTLLWQRDQWCTLPDVPFIGVTLTMPDVFWPIFKAYKHLQNDLPALGAAAIQQWAWTRHRVRLYIVVVQHTFGGLLNYHPHLHIMVSAGGLQPNETNWVESIGFDRRQIMELWRSTICSYVDKAYRYGLLKPPVMREGFNTLIKKQLVRPWNIHISSKMSKSHFLRYAGRYIRRLPISQKRIIQVTEREVTYRSKDTRTRTYIENRCTPAEFVNLLSPHVLDHYRHSMRYFGLLAPRMKRRTSAAVFALFGQQARPRPPRQSWVASIRKHFGVDPLRDAFGKQMHWVGHHPSLSAA
jgi:hypothetical protein